MKPKILLSALTDKRIANCIGGARQRIIYAAPGIQINTAEALANIARASPEIQLCVNIDFDEHVLRMGYGRVEAVETLKNSTIEVNHSPGLRSGILIVDSHGWVFTPTALYLEAEPQSDETPNAVALSSEQIQEIAIRLSPAEKEKAISNAPTPEASDEIASTQPELGVETVDEKHFEQVNQAIKTAPPVKFDVVRQVRVFEPYLQYVEISLSGAALQRKRVRIPKSLLTLGSSKDLEGKLKTTFDLIEKGGKLSSKSLEDELHTIRKNFTPSLGKDHGRVVLKAAKAKLKERISELREKLEAHQQKVEEELQAKLEDSKKQVVDYYLPLAKTNPPDELVGGSLNNQIEDKDIRDWIEEQLDTVFPSAESLVSKMTLEDRYKDVTFETLNREDFLESVKAAFPRVDWEKAYNEFRAAGEEDV